ncbi:unnamed protein product [Notodromas monacha]|uniref:diphosphoinositol-polyphosphate diphosphatase n=1 Tax=Notodromas monacha TaxID=399045 RepID=A0A7R9BFD9_9CRUS|nr:unnamed protein product [Notodromas monacha]CAG0914398.1 unnamed protein product [Notodromas monacha]
MVKDKPLPRMYDADGYKKRAACICVQTRPHTEVLLVTSSRMPEQWIVPGGSVEPEEDSSLTAMREVEEEAGVRGQLDGLVGIFEDDNRKTRTSVFVLIVTEELPEWEDSQRIGEWRKRKWFKLEEAAELLAAYKPIERRYLQMYLERNRVPESQPVADRLCHSDVDVNVVMVKTGNAAESSDEDQAPHFRLPNVRQH